MRAVPLYRSNAKLIYPPPSLIGMGLTHTPQTKAGWRSSSTWRPRVSLPPSLCVSPRASHAVPTRPRWRTVVHDPGAVPPTFFAAAGGRRPPAPLSVLDAAGFILPPAALTLAAPRGPLDSLSAAGVLGALAAALACGLLNPGGPPPPPTPPPHVQR
jgi:hypothetical protein